MKDFLAITGPTTSGKTSLSILVAEAIGGEVVSMDSRQIYRGMDIGTDKVSPSDRGRVPHHGLDIRNPDEAYSAGEFSRDARRWIDEIRGRGKTPVLAGGTGFFLRALTHPIFEEPPLRREDREPLRAYLDKQEVEDLVRWVSVTEPERAELLIAGGPQRMARALEVALLTGRTLGWWHEAAPGKALPLNGLVVRLCLPREELVRRIDARVGRMVERGFIDEVRGILEEGYGSDSPGMTSTGYREIASYLCGDLTLDAALEEMRRQTRKYAKRQETWFRRKLPDDVVCIDARFEEEAMVDEVVEVWRKREGDQGREIDG